MRKTQIKAVKATPGNNIEKRGRPGKIERLPKCIQDQIRIRMSDGQLADEILPWLNGLPETKVVVKEHFKGVSVNNQNLSDWRCRIFDKSGAIKRCRNGKIARLPTKVRDQVNQRLDNGQIGPEILPWLNSLAETKGITRKWFKGQKVNPQNLSDWRLGGYQEWKASRKLSELGVPTRISDTVTSLLVILRRIRFDKDSIPKVNSEVSKADEMEQFFNGLEMFLGCLDKETFENVSKIVFNESLRREG